MTVTPLGLDPSSVEALGGALLRFVLQGAVIAAVLAVSLRFLARASAQVRYLAACGTLLAMLAAPVATFFTLRASMPAQAAPPTLSAVTAIPERVGEEAIGPTIGHVDASVPESRPHRVRVTAATLATTLTSVAGTVTSWWPDLRERMTPWLVVGWGLGVALLTLRLIGGWWLVRRLGRASHQALELWRAPMARLAQRMGVSRAVLLCQSNRVDVPTTIGWLRPIVLLPASAVSGLGPAQIEAILAHELAHIRRHDYLVNLLQSVVETLLFYHPAVWWVSRRIREERELCCDDLAVRSCGDAVTYARALYELEALRPLEPAPWLAMAATRGSLARRIARLIGRSADVADARGLAGTLLAAVVVVTLAAVGLGFAPRGSADASPPIDEPEATKAVIPRTCATAEATPTTEAMDEPCPAATARPATKDCAADAPESMCSSSVAASSAPAPETAAPAAPASELPPVLEPLASPAPQVACDAQPTPTPPEELDDVDAAPEVTPAPPALVLPRRAEARACLEAQRRQARGQRLAARAQSISATTSRLFARNWAHLLQQRENSRGELPAEDQERLQRMGLTEDYVRRVSDQLATPPSADELGKMHSNGVTPEWLARMRHAGLELTPDDAVRLTSHGVSPEYVAGLRGMDPNEIGVENLIRLMSNGVSAEWLSEMHWLGYRDLSVDQAIALTSNGVRPDQVGQFNLVARRSFLVEELIQLVTNGVDVAYVAKLRDRVRKDLTVNDLVRLRQNGVDPEQASALEVLGYRRLSPDELVALQQNGVDAGFAAEMLQAGLEHPNARDLIRLHQEGVSSEFLERVNESGMDHVSIDELIRMHRSGDLSRSGR